MPVFTIDGPPVQYGGLGIAPSALGALDRQNVGTLTMRIGEVGNPARFAVSVPPWVRRRYRFNDGLGGWFDDFLSSVGALRRSVVAVEGDCLAGEDAIANMVRIFDKLGRPAKYEIAVQVISDRYREVTEGILGRIQRQIPYYPLCGTIYRLGQSADSLIAQMTSDADIVTPGPSTTPSSGGRSWLEIGLMAAGALALVGGGFYLYKRTRKGRR